MGPSGRFKWRLDASRAAPSQSRQALPKACTARRRSTCHALCCHARHGVKEVLCANLTARASATGKVASDDAGVMGAKGLARMAPCFIWFRFSLGQPESKRHLPRVRIPLLPYPIQSDRLFVNLCIAASALGLRQHAQGTYADTTLFARCPRYDMLVCYLSMAAAAAVKAFFVLTADPTRTTQGSADAP